MIYIACDPGVVSGLARWDTREPDLLKTEEVPDLGTTAGVVDGWMEYAHMTYDEVVFVSEMFTISKRTITGKVFYESLYFNGWATIVHPDVIMQTPAQAKKFATDEKLRHLGWFTRSKDGHANDAARHLLYRAVKNREPYVIDKLKEMV